MCLWRYCVDKIYPQTDIKKTWQVLKTASVFRTTFCHDDKHTHTHKLKAKQIPAAKQSRMCWEFSPFSLFIAHSAPHFTNHVVLDENKSVNLLFLALIQLIDGDIMIALPNVERRFWGVFKSSRHMDLWHTEMSLQTVFTHPADTDQHYHPVGEVLLASISM